MVGCAVVQSENMNMMARATYYHGILRHFATPGNHPVAYARHPIWLPFATGVD
jgi:hypothetical protein